TPPSLSYVGFHYVSPNHVGWGFGDRNISGAREFSDLPKNAQDYVVALEKMARVVSNTSI
ncbi:MAG: hypothetical protein ABWU13_18560, partial [Limnospira maxima]